MATIVDVLLVQLGFELSEFKKGQKEAQEGLKKTSDESSKRAKEIEAKAKIMADAFKKFRQEVATALGAVVSVSGLKNFAEKAVTADAAVKRLADNLGVGVERITAWQAMAQAFGGSTGDMEAAFRNVNRIVQEIRTTGGSEAILPLTKLIGGESLAEFVSASTTIEQRMKLVQRAIAGAPNRQNALTYAQQAGFSEETFTVMKEIGSELDPLLRKYTAASALTKEQAEQAKRLEKAWLGVTQALQDFGKLVLYTLGPLIEKVLKLAEQAFRFFGKSGEEDSLGTTLYDFMNAPAGPARGAKKPGTKATPQQRAAAVAAEFDRLKMPQSTQLPGQAPAQRMWPGGPFDWRNKPGGGGASDANRWGTEAFSKQLLEDVRNGAEFSSPELRERLTQSPAAYLRSMLSNIPSASRSAGSTGASTSTTEVHIGAVHVTTQATDADGIARDIVGALKANYSLAVQSNRGAR